MSKLPTIPKKFFDMKSEYLPNGKVTLSPFTVGLESLLIQVKDAEDESEKMDAIRQIIDECLQTKGVDVDKLPLFIIEEMFIRLRQNSIGEIVEQTYQCNNTENLPENIKEDICNKVIPVSIDLREFKLIKTEGHTNKIIINEPIGMTFKYPNMAMANHIKNGQDDIETIIQCIDMIFDADNVYPASESTHEELLSFWKELTLMQKKLIYDKFFTTMPHVHYSKDITCPQCKAIHNIEFNSVQEVFQ